MAYTTIDDPSAYFQTKIYTGNGSANHAITNDGNSDLQPDLVWIKNRDATDAHCWFDSTRGATKFLSSNAADAESTDADTLDSFASDGFQVDADVKVNTNTEAYVAWQWKANGGTTSSNTDGDITSTVQANTTAGFSIVSWTGSDDTNPTIGHGLSTAPTLVITKNRTSGNNWLTGVTESGFNWNTDYYHLNSSDAKSTDAGGTGFYRAPTSTTISSGGFNHEETSSNYIAYCFHSVQGYSKIGTFVGANKADGTFIYTGFTPAFVLVKNKSTSHANHDWIIFDNTREANNEIDTFLKANENAAETTSGRNEVDFLSNGFKGRSTYGDFNGGGTFIYMAVAKHPFVSSEGVPATAR